MKRKPTSDPRATVIYTRLSLDQNGEGTAVARQLKDCRALCARNGWNVVAEITDNDVSASRYSRKRRKGYAELLGLIHAGAVDRIVVYHLDRLYRQPRELEDLIDYAERGALEIRTLHGDLDLNTDAGQLVGRMLCAASANESANNSRRTKRAKQEARRAGKQPGGVVAFGWYGSRHGIDPETDAPYVNNGTRQHPDEAALIREAAELYLSGTSLTALARIWNEQKVPKSQGGHTWSPTHLRLILTAPRNAGKVLVDGQHVEAVWPAILDEDSWLRCVAKADMNAKRGPRRRSPYTGLLRCALCKHPMVRSGSPHTQWRCRRRVGGPPNCGKTAISAALLEETLMVEVFDSVRDGKLRTTMRRRNRAAARKSEHDDGRELADIEHRIDEMEARYVAGKIDARQFDRMNEKLRARREELMSRLALDDDRRVLAPYADEPGALESKWPLLDDDAKRTVLRALLDRVEIKPAKQRGRYSFDPTRVVPFFRM